MITVTLFNKNGRITGVRAVGHSDLAESGNDILCAAVSTLVQTAYLAISDIAGEVKCTRDKKSAKFEFEVPDGEHNHDADEYFEQCALAYRTYRAVIRKI